MNASPARAHPRLTFRITIVLCAAVFLVGAVVADDAGSRSTPPGRSFNPATLPSGAADPSATPITQGDRLRFMNDAASHYSFQSEQIQPDFYFFPPYPPPLGAPLRPFYLAPKGMPAPAELAAYVNEPFYSVLGVRLVAEDLPRRIQLGLAAYRAAKVEMQNELRAKIVRLTDVNAATREQELAALARTQTPRIVELEATAAQLRTDLQRSGVYGVLAGRGDWNETRTWRLSSKPDEKAAKDTLEMEYRVMRAAVCYQEGLSAAQRRLLREIAMEIDAEIRETGARLAGGAGPSWFFFMPETARIRVPADLPAGLSGEIAAFVGEKNQLKAELRDALRRYDATVADERTRALKQLSVSQAPRIAALEEQAEHIRRGLANVTDMPGPPAPPPLPKQIVAQISEYRSHKADLLKVLLTELAKPATAGPSREGAVAPHEQVAAFNRAHDAQCAQLTKERDGIREALAQYVRSENAPQDRKSINDLLEEFENARQEQELWEQYRDYQSAVLLPGLSAEQRRLLFDAAVEKLALPLPTGEVAH